MSAVACLLLGCLAVPLAWDEPRSPIRAKLDVATATCDQAIAVVSRDYEQLAAAKLPEAEQAKRAEAIEDRWQRAIKPSFDEVLDVAESHPDDPSAVEALGFIALRARGLPTDESRRALVALRRDHAQSPTISTATRTMFVHTSRPEAIDLLRAVIAENPHRTERGRACEDLAWTLDYQAGLIDGVRASPGSRTLPANLEGADPAALRREAEAFYERCVAEFADIPLIGYGAGKTIGEFAAGALTNLRALQVGKRAPDIEGQDVAGQPLRLRDYRGRMVVLVFSGEWCGPCKAAAPLYRDLLKPENQQTNPCVVLEVNSDATREPLRQAIAQGEITWPCWFDGGVTGPITMAWGNANWPFLYIIDPDGIIRARDVRRETIAAALAQVWKDRRSAQHP